MAVLPMLRFIWLMSKGVISWPVKVFFIFSILAKLLRAKKHPKLCILLPTGKILGLVDVQEI